jgi:hypothetical protein
LNQQLPRSNETAANNSKFVRRLILHDFLLHSSASENASEQLAIPTDDDSQNRTQSFCDNGTHSNNSPKLMSRQILVATSE